MLRWVFLDVGGPIIDDDAWIAEVDRLIAEGLQRRGFGYTTAHVTEARLGAVRNRMGSSVKGAIEMLAGGSLVQVLYRECMEVMVPRYAELARLREGVAPVLEALALRYRLGLIANQPKEVHAVLERLGVRRFFSVAAISGDLGYAKPDQRIFAYALEESGCPPSEAAFIGDRLDNDIRPAKGLGFRTILFRDGYLRGLQAAALPEEVPDEAIDDIRQLPDAIRRIEERTPPAAG